MKRSYIPPYGHACCPHCRNEFNLTEAQPTFGEKTPHNDTAIYVMCHDCHATFQSADEAIRQTMYNTCFVNFKLRGVAENGGRIPFAITTTLTLALNDWCITAAVENGHGLTKSEYFEICSREYQVFTLPIGLRVIYSQERVQ